MKKIHPLRELLGLTQQEAAQLLGVTRAHWSMFECGKRDLPLESKKILAELLTVIDQSEKALKESPQNPDPKLRHEEQKLLERLLRENEYQLMVVTARVEDLYKKFDAQRRSDNLNELLKGFDSSQSNASRLPAQIGKFKNAAAVDPLVDVAFQLQHRLEMLTLENDLLKSKLKSYEL